jgi:DNA-binding SARP family transcriptional activator/TolB-like protein
MRCEAVAGCLESPFLLRRASRGRIGGQHSLTRFNALSARFNAVSTPAQNRQIETQVVRLRTFGGLSIENPGADSEAGARPRQLALLAILGVAAAKGVTRDRVLSVLWPETDEERARQSLSQAVYSLRRDLGIDVALSPTALRIDPAQISSDVGEFRAAVAAKNWTEAAALYTGPFLDGFYLADAPEFERWAESERASLTTEAIRAIEIVAKTSAENGRRQDAAEHWHRLTELDPTNSRIAASYMEALAAAGDRATAVAHGRAHIDFLRRELDAEPDQGFGQLVSRLREADAATPPDLSVAPTSPHALAAKPSPAPNEVAARDAPRNPRGKAALIAASLVVMSILAILGWRSAAQSRASSHPVLAVGRIRDLAASDSGAFGAVLSEMLATSLGRLDELQVIANSRMLELTPRDADTSRSALTDAARRAGATEVVEGELIPLPDRNLRLEIRRVDVGRGLVRGGYRITGRDRVALFDSVTALIAADFRIGAPTQSLADVTTRSPIAYRFYEEGLRAFYQFDAYAANRLFQSAVREDSTFAMATYYAWRVAKAFEDPSEGALGDRAVVLASRASPRDRLLILTHVGAARSDLRAIAAAETLATNYPRDPEALVRAAEVVQELPRAAQLLNRSIQLDSAANPGSTPVCRLCDAFGLLTSRYEWADSIDAVQRTLGRWHAFRPDDAGPWAVEADWLIGQGRRAEAGIASRRYEALGGRNTNGHLSNLVTDMRLDALDAADRACQEGLIGTDTAEFILYRWHCVIALRIQGRYREALALAREGRVPKSTVVHRGVTLDKYQAAILDMEMGRALTAADEFLEIIRPNDDAQSGGADAAKPSARPVWEGLRARYRAWILTLSATAAVAGDDTVRARRLVDSIEIVGHRSLFGRDPLLHHFVRGLLFSRARQHDDAVREFRAAMHSPTFGYTRINYELGKSLLELNRPAEAIPVVQGALHGGLEGAGLYITRTELHELLAQSFDANRQRDSAAAHYAVVDRAWASADPFLRARHDAARQWLARNGR